MSKPEPQHRTDTQDYNRMYRLMIMNTRKPGHEKCTHPGCCYHGRLNANREYMRRMREKRAKEGEPDGI